MDKEKSTVRVPGSCGELAQGLLGEKEFLISCPVDIYSEVTVKLSDGGKIELTGGPYEKTRNALKKTLKHYKREELGLKADIKSFLHIGKGMGSSTADMVAAIAGVMKALNCEIDLDIIKNIIISIEPSDCTFLPGINLFNHKTGEKISYLGAPPAIDILMFCEPGKVDTIKFNQDKTLLEAKRKKSSYVRQALSSIKEGLKKGDKYLIGKGATLSSIAHQNIVYKPSLNKILTITQDIPGVYGVNIAHSGTLIGILVEPGINWDNLIKNITKDISDLSYITRSRIISGGIDIIE